MNDEIVSENKRQIRVYSVDEYIKNKLILKGIDEEEAKEVSEELGDLVVLMAKVTPHSTIDIANDLVDFLESSQPEYEDDSLSLAEILKQAETFKIQDNQVKSNEQDNYRKYINRITRRRK